MSTTLSTTLDAPLTPAQIDTLTAAVECLESRKARTSHPDGRSDGKRWYPAASERQDCCSAIRSPSAAYPWSLMVHCRTAQHVALLYGVHRVDLERAVRARTPRTPRPVEVHTRYKIVQVDAGEEGRAPSYHSLYDPAHTYDLGKTYRQAAKAHHGGGWYVRALEWHETRWNERDLPYMHTTTLTAAFLAGDIHPQGRPPVGTYALLRCEVWGRCVEYANGKEAWTYCKPVEVVDTFVVGR
jgi:hypothetical protein